MFATRFRDIQRGVSLNVRGDGGSGQGIQAAETKGLEHAFDIIVAGADMPSNKCVRMVKQTCRRDRYPCARQASVIGLFRSCFGFGWVRHFKGTQLWFAQTVRESSNRWIQSGFCWGLDLAVWSGRPVFFQKKSLYLVK